MVFKNVIPKYLKVKGGQKKVQNVILFIRIKTSNHFIFGRIIIYFIHGCQFKKKLNLKSKPKIIRLGKGLFYNVDEAKIF